MLAIVQVPQEGLAILTSGGAQGTVGRNGNRVQVAIVAQMVNLQLAVGQIPDLNDAIPTGRDDDRVRVVWRETDARDPVSVAILLDGVLAFGQSVPQLDGLVTRSGHDLTVVHGESNRQDILLIRKTFPVSHLTQLIQMESSDYEPEQTRINRSRCEG